MVRFIVSIALALTLWLVAYLLEGGVLVSLLGLTAFLIVFFVPLFGVLAIWNGRAWRQAWVHAFRKADAPAQAQVSVALWKFSEYAYYLAGVLGWLTGAVLILGNVAQVDLVRFAASNAAGLVAPVYGMVLGFIARILRTRVETINTN